MGTLSGSRRPSGGGGGGGGGGSGKALVADDASSVFRFKWSEDVAANERNWSTGKTLPNLVAGGPNVALAVQSNCYPEAGPFGAGDVAYSFDGSMAGCAGANTVAIPSAFTVGLFYRLQPSNSQFRASQILAKLNTGDPNAYSDQPDAYDFLIEMASVAEMDNAETTGNWNVRLRTGGTIKTVGITMGAPSYLDQFVMPYQRWVHIGVTYDGAALRAFLNGSHFGAVAATGAVSASTGGPWCVGKPNPTQSAARPQSQPGSWIDFRCFNVAKDFAFMRQWARSGLAGL
jgi:Concanavalin A-like lectin/glucanases superfamily